MPPLAIAAGLSAVGTIGGALIGAHAQSQASQLAAQTQNNATAAQLQLGQQSLALNQGIYNSNYNTLSPWVSRGNVAGDAYNSMLGLPAAPAMTSPMAGTTPMAGGGSTGAPAPSGYAQQNDLGYQPNGYGMAARSAASGVATPNSLLAPPTAASAARPVLSDYRGNFSGFQDAMAAYRAAHPAGTVASGASGGNSAFNNFAHSAGIDFQMQQGTNALNNLYAAHGMLQSGDAMKGISNYAQQTALNNYFMPYMGMLNGVSGQGLSAGSAIAGVGSSFGNTAAGINGEMGNAINSGAQNIGNLQLANGQNQANMWGSIGGALGGLASSFAPSGGTQIPPFVRGTQLPMSW